MIQRVTPELATATDTAADLSAIDDSLALLAMVEQVRPIAATVTALAVLLRRAPEVSRLTMAAEGEYRELLEKLAQSRESAAATIAHEAAQTHEARHHGQVERDRLAGELAGVTTEHQDALGRLATARTEAERAHEEFLAQLARDREQANTDAAAHRTTLEAEIVAATERRDAIVAQIEDLKAKFR